MNPRSNKRVLWSTSIAACFLLALAVLGPLISYKTVENSICPVSGSIRRETVWFGTFHREKRTVSPLETWLQHHEPGFQPAWKYLSTQTFQLLGRSCATAGAPEVYSLIPFLDQIVAELDDARIAQMVDILRHGTKEEQRAMIETAFDEMLSNRASR